MAKIRLHLDENVAVAVAEGLRRRGIDVTTARDTGLVAAQDEEHLRFALREGRVLLTHDQDFLRFHSAGHQHRGLLFCPKNARTIGQIIHSVCTLVDLFEPEDFENWLEYL